MLGRQFSFSEDATNKQIHTQTRASEKRFLCNSSILHIYWIKYICIEAKNGRPGYIIHLKPNCGLFWFKTSSDVFLAVASLVVLSSLVRPPQSVCRITLCSICRRCGLWTVLCGSDWDFYLCDCVLSVCRMTQGTSAKKPGKMWEFFPSRGPPSPLFGNDTLVWEKIMVYFVF